MIYVKAFVVGGIICTLVQIFLDHTKLMPGRVMVLLVITGVILGAAGIYEPLIKWAGCGASVPLSGFGYNLSKGVIEAVKEEGTIGLFKGGLKAAAAGTSSALIFSYLAALIFQPKMKVKKYPIRIIKCRIGYRLLIKYFFNLVTYIIWSSDIIVILLFLLFF